MSLTTLMTFGRVSWVNGNMMRAWQQSQKVSEGDWLESSSEESDRSSSAKLIHCLKAETFVSSCQSIENMPSRCFSPTEMHTGLGVTPHNWNADVADSSSNGTQTTCDGGSLANASNDIHSLANSVRAACNDSSVVNVGSHAETACADSSSAIVGKDNGLPVVYPRLG
jgi:hypothetical protein